MNNNNINLKPTEKMGYINFWCQKVIPLVFDDSLSYYEAICKFMQKLNEVISALNNNAECIDELQGKYIILQNNFDALEVKWEEFKTEITTKEENFETTINNEFNSFKTYVENYLNNIDVQSYVNVKIDELAESGYFSTLLTNLGFNPDNYLAKNNTTAYVPTNDYNPATKKYVDEHSSQGVVYNAGDGIKIENNTISSENYYLKNLTYNTKDTTNNDGIYCNGNTIILGRGNSDLAKYLVGNVKVLGKDNKWGNGSNYSCILGNNNNISGDNDKAVVIVGRNNATNKEDVLLGEYLKNFDTNSDKSIIIGTYNDTNFTGKNIIIGNGIDNNNRHNAFVIPQGTTNPIIINQEVNCNDNFITRTFVKGDNVDTIYAEKPNALVNASEVKASIKSINDRLDKYDKQLIYGITYENNVTGNTQLILRNGFYFLNMSVTYPSSITGNDSTLTLFRININSSDTKINGFKNFNAIIVNKNDTSSKERTAPIRVVKLNDTEYSIVYVGNETENKPYNYTIEFGGVIGYL